MDPSMYYAEPKVGGPPPPDAGVATLIAILKAVAQEERARVRYWLARRCDRAGRCADGPDPADTLLTGAADAIAIGIRHLNPSGRAYVRRWLIAWYTEEGWLREPPFLMRRRQRGH